MIDPCDPGAASPTFAAADTLPTGAPAVLRPELATVPDFDAPAFVPARRYAVGRTEAVALVVIHTAEVDCRVGAAAAVARYFAGPTAPQASAHYVVGPDETIACVREEDTAYGAGKPANARGLHVEHAARASFTAADWATPDAQAMLARSAALVAALCRRHGIPVVRLDAAALLREERGITGHVDVSRAWHGSDHWDPGPAFPWENYLEMVKEAGER